MKFSEVVKNASIRAGEPIPNTDPETGIAYGVISSTDERLCPEQVDYIPMIGTDLDHEDDIAEVRERLRTGIQELIGDINENHPLNQHDADLAIDQFVDEVAGAVEYGEDDADRRYLLEWEGYSILLCRDGDLFIQKSPYYALRGECSPCAPCAGHLNTDGDMKTYVLGHAWWESGAAPFPIYCVSDGSEVKSEIDTKERP